ncbi:hypothetical protein [Bradyrhizobium liaoningense]|uniref:hypothetical protein n=1 Tax=Bradyrhizobium liaoningense TaxID=43992 RepID=UPI001BAB7660|nr:hypothetical protein [Bradyrhizobium liaoningense]MBR0948324.1 hypothetical protein [Bradyrhizobium liaoningense]
MPDLSRYSFVSRDVLLGLILALILSSHAVLVLCYGLVGSAGYGAFTATILAAPTAALLLLCIRKGIEFHAPDFLFLGLLLAIAISFLLNPRAAPIKEIILLILTFSTYPACRFISSEQIGRLMPSFAVATGAFSVIGAVVTAVAMYEQWGSDRVKPVVLGFEAAPIYFLTALGLFMLAVVSRKMTARRAIVLALFLFPLIFIFSAAMVRFTFIAIFGALVVATLLSDSKQRWRIGIVSLGIVAGIVAGLATRSKAADFLITYTMEAAGGHPVRAAGLPGPDVNVRTDGAAPSCHTTVNLRNSLDIRKAVFRDALFYIPKAGAFGYGLDGFTKLSCVEGTQVHNSIMQAIVEFGWIGGACFVLLIFAAGIPLLPISRIDDDVRFIVCGLSFAVMLIIAYGRISQDAIIFAFIGCSAGALRRNSLFPTRGYGATGSHKPQIVS